MTTDLNEFSYEELITLQRSVDKAIQSYGKRRKKEALDEMKSVAVKYGFSFGDLVGYTKNPKEAKGEPKYRNPESSAETWTGKGRKPGWVVSALEAGKDLEDMKIW